MPTRQVLRTMMAQDIRDYYVVVMGPQQNQRAVGMFETKKEARIFAKLLKKSIHIQRRRR